MKRLIYLFLLLPILANSQKADFSLSDLGDNMQLICDSDTRETLVIEYAGSLTCCYDALGGKIDCPDEFTLGGCVCDEPEKEICYELNQEIEGSQAATWVIIAGELEVDNVGGNQNGAGPFVNTITGNRLEYSVDGGMTYGQWQNTLGGGGTGQVINTDPVYIRDGATGTPVLIDITSFSGGGSTNYTALALLGNLTVTCIDKCGELYCCDELGNEIDFSADWEVIECIDKVSIMDTLIVINPNDVVNKKCYTRQGSFFDNVVVIDSGNRDLTDDIVVTPDESGKLCEIETRVDNRHPINTFATDSIQFFLDGVQLPIISNNNSAPPTFPVNNANEAINTYRLDAGCIDIVVGQSYTMMAVLWKNGVIITDNLIGWQKNDGTAGDADGQATFASNPNGDFPAVHWLNGEPEVFCEEFLADGSIKYYDPLRNEIERIPFDAEPIDCNIAYIPNEIEPDTLSSIRKVTISGADSLFTTIKDVCSQEYTYAVDNTGTTTNEAATWTFTLSNGTSIVVDQVNQGSTSQWTPQMQQVGADLQTAADNAGIKWLVETRCILGPTNPNGCGGFAGPPSEVVGQALWDGGQRARYINIQICPGEPTISSVLYESASRSLQMVTAGPVLGPVQEFRVKEKCTSNGVELSWFIKEDSSNYVPATAGQIPFCAAPCAGLSDAPPPEQGDCDFKVVEACDNNNSQLTADFTQLITRIVPLCNGIPGTPNYYTEENGSLVDYTLVGQFVDCATGEIIPLPMAECEVDGIIELFSMEGVNGLLRNREWFDYAPAASPFPLTSDHGRGIRESFDFTTPTTSDGTQSSLVINDSNNTASILDVQVVDGYIVVEEPIQSRYNGGSEGYWAVELGQCCGSLELLNESGGFSPDREMTFTLPKGTHQIRIWNIDSGGSNSSANFSYSLDGGVTYISDNTPPGVSFSQSKPNEICKKIKSCTNGAYTDLRGNTIDLDDCYECSISCDPVITSSSSSDTQLRTLRID